MLAGFFVVGTDTGVGKTVVTAALVHGLRSQGRDAVAFKPVQSGNLVDDPTGDAATLVRLGDLRERADDVNVFAFAEPLAPVIAASREGRRVELDPIVARATELVSTHELLVVEGAGGLLVPISEELTVADVAEALALPLVVVGRPGLGTVNHTALTVAAARALGLAVAGVVLNGYRDGLDGSVEDNPSLIERLTGVTVIGRTPWLEGELTSARVRAEIAPAIDVSSLVRERLRAR